ncbi:MAG: HmuY family protein, partial [Myxococcota bacterium]|nr:HmuY family protein [Myxococcota bacterium]
MKTNKVWIFFIVAMLSLLGCEETIDGVTGSTEVDSSTVQNEDGSYSVTVDATSKTEWTYYSFKLPGVVAEGDDWDLAFQRSFIKANGGASGDGPVIVTHIDENFAEVTKAPDEGYRYASTDEDGEPVYAFDADGNWYDYDISTHILTPKNRTYVVRTATGFYKMAVLDYYGGDAPTSAVYEFQWGSVTEPGALVEPDPVGSGGTDGADLSDGTDGHDGSDGKELPDVPDGAVRLDGTEKWAYLSFANGPVNIEDAANSTEWDLGVKGYLIRTNSGLSGPGLGGAVLMKDTTWESVVTTDTVGFAIDEEINEPGPPGSVSSAPASPTFEYWYDYNFTTHELTAKDSVYVVRGGSGTYAKVTLMGGYDGVYDVKFESLDAVPMVHTTTIDTTSRTVWSFRMGASMEVDEATSLDWDIAVDSLVIATNSGTSGSGNGGAYDPDTTDFASLLEIKDDWAFTSDSMMPLPGPPGSGDISGNTVLGNWYDYDFVTHTVSASGRVYVVAT